MQQSRHRNLQALQNRHLLQHRVLESTLAQTQDRMQRHRAPTGCVPHRCYSQEALAIWRIEALGENFGSIEDTGDRVVLHCVNARPDTFYVLPTDVVKDGMLTKMVLTTALCSGFIAYFADILGQMLKGTCMEVSRNNFLTT
jgi:hypothetical protein